MIDSYFTLFARKFARKLNRLFEETKNKQKIGHILISKCVGRKKIDVSKCFKVFTDDGL